MAKTGKYLVVILVDGDGASAATIRAAFAMAMQMHNIKGKVLDVRAVPKAREVELKLGEPAVLCEGLLIKKTQDGKIEFFEADKRKVCKQCGRYLEDCKCP